jgi:hypothetical protein
MADVYRMVGEKPPAAAAAAPAVKPQQPPAAPYVFAPADISNPYAMKWDAYSTKLKPDLDSKYSAGRAQPSAQKVNEGDKADEEKQPADAVKAEISRIKGYLDNDQRKPAGFRTQQVNEAVNKAVKSPEVTAVAGVVPFDINAFRVAILAQLNANAPAGFRYPGVGP